MADNNIKFFFQILFALQLAIAFIFVALILFSGRTTLFGTTYAWVLVAGLVLWIMDIAVMKKLKMFSFNETPEEDAPEASARYPAQLLTVLGAFAISVIGGIILAGYYTDGVRSGKAYVGVTEVFAGGNVPTYVSFLPKSFFNFVQAFVVANAEEMLFVGILGSGIVFAILGIMLLMARKTFEDTGAVIALSIIAILIGGMINGWVSSWILHSFNRYYSEVAFDRAWRHFTYSTWLTTSTGFIQGSVIAHTVHNYEVKERKDRGFFGGDPTLLDYLPRFR